MEEHLRLSCRASQQACLESWVHAPPPGQFQFCIYIWHLLWLPLYLLLGQALFPPSYSSFNAATYLTRYFNLLQPQFHINEMVTPGGAQFPPSESQILVVPASVWGGTLYDRPKAPSLGEFLREVTFWERHFWPPSDHGCKGPPGCRGVPGELLNVCCNRKSALPLSVWICSDHLPRHRTPPFLWKMHSN